MAKLLPKKFGEWIDSAITVINLGKMWMVLVGHFTKLSLRKVPYKWIYWRVEYLVNQSVIVVGVTLIWRKAVAAVHINSYKTLFAIFKFGGQTKNRQTAKLKSPPNIPRIRYFCKCVDYKNVLIFISCPEVPE